MTDPSSNTFNRNVARINEISRISQGIWFVLLIYISFASLTLLRVSDVDFFDVNRQTTLPVIGVDVPTASFFWSGPLLGAVLYCYFHFKLEKLWHALSKTDASHGERLLRDEVFPWMVNDLALSFRDDGSIQRTSLDWAFKPITLALVWLALPVVLIWFWVRSMPAHNPFVTGSISLVVAVSFYVGVTSWQTLRRQMGRNGDEDANNLPRNLTAATLLIVMLSASFLATATQQKVSMFGNTYHTLAPLDLSGAELTRAPPGWKGYQNERRSFLKTWCERKRLPVENCVEAFSTDNESASEPKQLRFVWEKLCTGKSGPPNQCADELHVAFKNAWALQLGRFKLSFDARDHNLAGADLRAAIMTGYEATVVIAPPNASVFDPRGKTAVSLRGVDLSGAQLQGANLRGADLRGARLIAANLVDADLSEANMEGADLSWANLKGANLTQAKLRKSKLDGARLDRANLSNAKLNGSDMQGAQLGGANLELADLRGTILASAQLVFANLADAWLSGASLEGADLTGANLESAQLWVTNFSNATLVNANLNEADLTGALLHSADLTCAESNSIGVNCNKLEQDQFLYTVGNSSTKLTKRLYTWTCLDENAKSVQSIKEGLALYRDEETIMGIGKADLHGRLFCNSNRSDGSAIEKKKLRTE